MSTKLPTRLEFKQIIKTTLLISIFFGSLTSCTNTGDSTSTDNNYSIDETITLEQVTKDVSYLASDKLQGRGNFSPNIHKAADYIANRFEQVGLAPLSTESSFLQEYTLQRIIPDTLTVKINGETIPQDKLAMVTTLNNFNWDSQQQQKNDKLTGDINIVFINENMNMRKSLRKLNYQGGQHLVLLHPKHRKSFKRYQGHFAKGSTQLSSMASATKTRAETHGGGVIVMALTPIDSIESYRINGKASIINTKLTNVVGILPGKSKANEIVLYSAHYDHLGVKDTDMVLTQSSSEIYNGADDDASGVSAIINLANHFAQNNNNDRTLLFAAFSAEELGGFGSRYFSEQVNPKSITAMINIEMIGKPATFGEGTVWMTGMDRSSLGELLNQTLAKKGLKIYADPYPEEKLFYRSDNATLARLGVPAHSFSSTQLDKDKHYHQTSDDIGSLNIPSMLQVIKTLAEATSPLVDGSVTPSRIDPNKVKQKGKIY